MKHLFMNAGAGRERSTIKNLIKSNLFRYMTVEQRET